MIEARFPGQPAEERESDQHGDEGYDQALADMAQAEVAELVSEHGFDLERTQLLEQGIEEHDALVAADAGEVGIAVGRPARAIDDEDAARAEAATLQKRLDAAFERGILER